MSENRPKTIEDQVTQPGEIATIEEAIAEYKAGRTPNPDVLCNREIKFDAFMHHAERLGADAIATGHYARLVHDESGTRLLRGADPGKDQSYFLSAVPMAALERTLFPLGDTYKADVRAIARDAGLPIHDKPDSTGVCFIGERDFEGFLRQYLSGKAGPVRVSGGPLDGKTIAEHAGLIYYTIGQRRGLGLGGVKGASQAPWFVAAKDLNTDTLWVTQDHDHPELARMSLTTSAPHWLIESPQLPRRCTAQVRYRQQAIDCRVDAGPDGGLTVHFDRPPRAIAPGQYAVFYDDDHCLGSAEIVALLLANKAKVDEPDAEGMTALHRAARGGHGAAIEVLIANGAAVNTKNKAGLTPLELADADAAEVLRKHGAQSAVKLGALSDDAANGNLEAVKQHLKAGSDVNGKDNLGRTPLYRAAYNGHKEIVELLLENKADTSARDANGWSPMHGSAYKGHVEIVAALIEAKAEVNAKDTDGDTPLDWAKNKQKVAELLRKNGAKTGADLKAAGK